MILISACLAGCNVKYDGTNNLQEPALRLVQDGRAMAICPEVMGGLPTPRIPAEIVNGSVRTRMGEDVTDAFHRGALATLELAKAHHAEVIILQERSPSCGVHQIYDGSFSNRLIAGSGRTTRLLRDAGFQVMTWMEWMEHEANQ